MLYHLPASRPALQTNPPPPTGSSSTQTPMSQITRLRNCRLCSASSLRCSSSSVTDGEGRFGDTDICGMTIDRGRLKKCVVMWTRAGRKKVLAHADATRTSLRTRAMRAGTRDRRTTRTKTRYFERGIVIARRMRSEMGRDGVVTSTDGMASSSVNEFNTAIAG